MELTEAVNRILRHWRLIIAVTVITMTIPVLLYMNREDTYVASTRMRTGGEATSGQESEAWVDAAKGVVTSPVQVAAVLDELAVERDPDQVAEKSVDVESVGISGVLVLSVTDSDPAVATDLANALSLRYIRSRREPVINPLEERLAELDTELAAADKTIARLESAPEEDPALAYARLVELEEAHQRRSDILSEQRELNTTLLSTPKPELIDAATAPTEPEPARLVANLVVAGLLGLVIAVAVAAAVEALRPTIVGRDSLARILGAPLLGEVTVSSHPDRGSGDRWLSYRVGLAASEAGVHLVRLMSAGKTVDLRFLAAQLRTASPNLAVEVAGPEPVAPATDPSARELSGREATGSATTVANGTDRDRPSTGLIVVAPEVLARDELNEVEYLLAMADWTLLGLIVVSPRRKRRTKAAPPIVVSSPSPSPQDQLPSRKAAAES